MCVRDVSLRCRTGGRLGSEDAVRVASAQRRVQLAEKDQIIMESQEAIQLLQMKIRRLEHLVQIKDLKIEELTRQLKTIGVSKMKTSTYRR